MSSSRDFARKEIKLMKKRFIVIIFFICACTQKIHQTESFIAGKTYKSYDGHLFRGNTLTFNNDSTFIYLGYGPSVFVSNGSWSYNNKSQILTLNSKKIEQKYVNQTSIDTLWKYFNQAEIIFKSRKKIMLDSVDYHLMN